MPNLLANLLTEPIKDPSLTEINGQASTTQQLMPIPFLVHSSEKSLASQPATFGLPFPQGALWDGNLLELGEYPKQRRPVQQEVLARWPDGSVQWLLLDSVLPSLSKGPNYFSLGKKVGKTPSFEQHEVRIIETQNSLCVHTGAVLFHLERTTFPPISRVVIAGQDILEKDSLITNIIDTRGNSHFPQIRQMEVEVAGPVKTTVRIEGVFGGGAPCRFVARCCFFAGTGLVRVRLTIHNPNRAKHRGGLWDLGDPGSIFFRDLSMQLILANGTQTKTTWTAEVGQRPQTLTKGNLEIYQDSSGGDNWRSPNHINRHGQVPCAFRGYRIRTSGEERFGLRASPVVSVANDQGKVTAAIPEFWQQFPKAIQADGQGLRLSLFPEQCSDLFELQGGEQKTHTFWLHFGKPEDEGVLDWVHQPARVRISPEWYAQSGAIPYLVSAGQEGAEKLDSYLGEIIAGENNLFARREVIDEYGWRHFGELYADHEAEHFRGPLPLISHYNNQYDFLGGAIVQYLRTGDDRWVDFFDPLARHVIDIDIYHTEQDRAAYNGGLFWFTDHYLTAATSTHRTYARANRMPGRSYGGGPSSNHNFTTGLLLYYYLTGDPNAREAVLSLANWVINMDDGRQTIFGLIDDGPTGSASNTGFGYQGPGRGGGNSINALLDAWQLTGLRKYLDKAEALIRRCIHPTDDVAAQDLLNVEKRWSYTVFLVALAKYLHLKAVEEDHDYMYAYAQGSLLHYAEWMVANEQPYFDNPGKLEYPTEAWAGQELRKANVLRLAAAHADEPLRSQLLRRGMELADRAWCDLYRFSSRYSARAVALVMAEGPLDAFSRTNPRFTAPRPAPCSDFGFSKSFIPQKQRVLFKLQTGRGLLLFLISLVKPWAWRKFFSTRY